jgi:hypothetical protein
LGPELETLLEAIGEPRLSAALLCGPPTAFIQAGQVVAVKRLARRIIDLTGDDPHFGDMLMESPLAVAAVLAATARMTLGEAGWRKDFDEADDLARRYLPVGRPMAMVWRYGYGVLAGALRPDEEALRNTAEMYEQADHCADASALEAARFLYGFILARRGGTDRGRGLEILSEARDSAWVHSITWFAQVADIELAREAARTGDADAAIVKLTEVLEHDRAMGGTVLAGSASSHSWRPSYNEGRQQTLTRRKPPWTRWPPCRPSLGMCFSRFRFFACVRCWHPRGATKPDIGNTAIAIEERRSRLSSRGMSRWPRRWTETGSRISRDGRASSPTDPGATPRWRV